MDETKVLEIFDKLVRCDDLNAARIDNLNARIDTLKFRMSLLERELDAALKKVQHE
jgi:hypothetical protein